MKHRIYVKNEQKEVAYTPAMRSYIVSAITKTLKYEQFEDPCEVSVTLTNDEGIRKLNKEYRDKDKETDVLSFPLIDGEYSEEDMIDGYLPLGDIVISLERCREQAENIGHSLNEEAAFLCVHSTLHLLGYDHETGEEDEKEMFDHQKAVMKLVRGEKDE
ncbi:MAG: rRNA maturation RNase YbeY [Clostridia bacterium]|nr:rRNA maturation RNase YbeY [Clostridia bacterium]MBQ3870385.1 rRNA maturation RNase YbeY [Clostridia bacterium]